MTLQEELLSKYEALLGSTGQTVGDDGKVYAEGVGDTLLPVTIDDKVLTLPTPELLRSGNWDGLQPFHPLSENSLRGESIVLKKLRILTASRIVTVLCSALEMLVYVAADTGMHAKLSPKASEFLDFAKKADEKTLKRLKTVLDKVSLTGDHRLLSFYFGRPGTQKKESFTRVCRVDFPILDELYSKEPTIFGVKMRHDDKATIKGVFKWLLNLDQENETVDQSELMERFGTGTHSLTTPYFYTLMTSYVKLGTQINSRLKLFKKSHPEQVKALHIDLDWADFLENLGRYRDIIPALAGNEGAVASHPGRRQQAESTEQPTAPALRQSIGLNTPVGSAGNETALTVPPVPAAAVVAPPTTPAPAQSVTPPPPIVPVPAQGNEKVVSWSSVVGRNQPAYSGVAPNGQPVYYQPAPTLANPNGRDLLRQQSYNRYQQSPHSYYNPEVQASIPPAPIGPQYGIAPVVNQFRTVTPQQPTISRPNLPSRW